MTALTRDGEVILQCRRLGDNGHSGTLLKDVENLMREAGWSYSDIDFIGTGIGPGSFTGVRVSVSTAKGLAMGLNKPIAPVCSLDAIAASMPIDMSVAVMIDAGRRRVYTALYPAGSMARESEIRLLPLNDLAGAFGGTPVMAAGPPLFKYGREIKGIMGSGLTGIFDSTDGLTARGFLRVALKSLKKTADPSDLTPLYLQEPTIRKKAT